MITKNQTKSLFFLDRDTDIDTLVDQILGVKRSEIVTFLNDKKGVLQEKEAGEYFTIEDILRLKEGELERMQRFFRGAVVPYYARQSRDIWSPVIPSGVLHECTNEIKREMSFFLYDHTGHITEELNSMASFARVKDLNEFLNGIKELLFDDNGFIFPDSEHFKQLEKEKGRHAAQRQVFLELKNEVKRKHYKGQM